MAHHKFRGSTAFLNEKLTAFPPICNLEHFAQNGQQLFPQ
jgi:hypothetical protein